MKSNISHIAVFFDNESEAPENSIPAFQRAVQQGYGIELDVQLTTDNRLVVFHDETLQRMCGFDKKLTECSYDELKHYRLAKSDEKIPLFDEVLKVIDGKVPLIVEVKSEGDWKKQAAYGRKNGFLSRMLLYGIVPSVCSEMVQRSQTGFHCV